MLNILEVTCLLSIIFILYYLYAISRNKKKPIIVSIDGNIGSGKSTLIRILQKELSKNKNIIFLQEPVNEWLQVKDDENNNILSKFYSEKKRWSYIFQNFAFITRTCIMLDAINKNIVNNSQKRKVIITERSTETDKYIFAKMLYDYGDMNQLEYNIYNYWYNNLIEKNTINNIVYLRTNPRDAFERINKRARSEEENIPFEYIQNVHNYHDKWLLDNTKNCNICYLDGSDNFEKNEDAKKKIVKSITVFINSLESRHYLFS